MDVLLIPSFQVEHHLSELVRETWEEFFDPRQVRDTPHGGPLGSVVCTGGSSYLVCVVNAPPQTWTGPCWREEEELWHWLSITLSLSVLLALLLLVTRRHLGEESVSWERDFFRHRRWWDRSFLSFFTKLLKILEVGEVAGYWWAELGGWISVNRFTNLIRLLWGDSSPGFWFEPIHRYSDIFLDSIYIMVPFTNWNLDPMWFCNRQLSVPEEHSAVYFLRSDD